MDTDAPVMTSPYGKRQILLDFTLMSVLFALNRAAGTVALNNATARFQAVGNIGVALVYLGYVFCAMTIASRICQKMGPKSALLVGLVAGCTYPAAFFFAVAFPDAGSALVIIGSALGGLASGEVWVAQGAYFSRAVEHYAAAAKVTPEVASGVLGGIFASVYVGFEVLMTGLSTVLLGSAGLSLEALFLIMGALAAGVCVLAQLFLLKIPPLVAPPPAPQNALLDDLLAALRLLRASRKMQLLYPFCIAFGFIDALTVTYLNAIVESTLGTSALGIFGAIPPFFACIAGLPLGYLGGKLGKGPLLSFGGLMLLCVGGVVTVNTETGLQSYGWTLSVLFIVEGLGRGVFEATTRGVFGDFFPKDSEPAFANLIIASGTASGIASFLFIRGLMPQFVIGLICVIATVLGLVASVLAFRVHKSEQDLEAMNKPFLTYSEMSAATDAENTYVPLSEERVAKKTMLLDEANIR
jgi:MFS family permease